MLIKVEREILEREEGKDTVMGRKRVRQAV